MLPKYVLYYGKDEPPPEQIPLRAGPLRMIYENGDLRYIRHGDQEVARRIYVAIRDHNWGTVPPQFSNVQMQIDTDSFAISYDVENKQNEIDFVWHGQITGTPDGTITFSMDGEARSTFRRNRIGFCVLHPIDNIAGTYCMVTHADGTTENSKFPQLISPALPFRNMTGLVYGDPAISIQFKGDVFETEDQRNWIDASFKTFCTPLTLPFPVEVAQGTRIAQSVTLTYTGVSDNTRLSDVPANDLAAPDDFTAQRLPHIGLGAASHGQPLSAREIVRLKVLHPAYLRVDVRLSEPGWQIRLRQNAAEAAQIGVALELALFLSDAAESELAALRAELESIRAVFYTCLIFHVAEKVTTARWIALARGVLTSYAPYAKFGGGTNAYLNELNANRPDVTPLDLVSYSINPQVHAFDNASLVETLGAIPDTVRTAQSFCGDRLIAISPVTLKPRFNVVATGTEAPTPPGELPWPVDVRQMSLFGAAWTLGVFVKLVESGVHSVTFYETTGWRGVMEMETGSALPEKFRSIPGSVFPMYHVLRGICGFSSHARVKFIHTDPMICTALVLSEIGHSRLLAANLTTEPQSMSLDEAFKSGRLTILDETNVETAMSDLEGYWAQPGTPFSSDTLHLGPYAIAQLDSTWIDDFDSGDNES